MKRRASISGLGAAFAIGALGPDTAVGQLDNRLAGNGFVTLRPRTDADRRTENRFGVFDPFGNEIDQAGTQTQGLQGSLDGSQVDGVVVQVVVTGTTIDGHGAIARNDADACHGGLTTAGSPVNDFGGAHLAEAAESRARALGCWAAWGCSAPL